MKRILLLLFALSCAAFAQGPGAPPRGKALPGGCTLGDIFYLTQTDSLSNPPGLYAASSAGPPCVWTASGTTVTVASGTAALGTGAITNGTCATAVTVAATGVLTTDVIAADFNADPSGVTGYNPAAGAQALTIYKFPTSGNVNFKVCNFTAGSITPGAITLNWRVIR